MMRFILTIWAFLCMANFAKAGVEDLYCDCDCNGKSDFAGIWIADTNPLYNPLSKRAPRMMDGMWYSYACLSDDDVFDILWDHQGFCDDTVCE